jgi:F-type H+-transporting ATPase subunit b
MSLLNLLAAADAGPVEQIAKTFGANEPALIANAISFVLVALILKKWAVGPIQNALEDRRAAIAQGLADAARAKEDLASAQQKAQELLAEVGAQSAKAMEEARAAAARVAEAETRRAVAAAEEIVAKARQSNDAELARLKAELRQEFGRLVVAASMEVTGKILTLDDQKRLAEETQRQLAA